MGVMNHLGICVADLNVSREFYVEVFGFRPWRVSAPPDRVVARLLQLGEPVGLRAEYLTLDAFVLELLHYEHRPSPERPLRAMDELGLTHISISRDDVDATCDAVEAHGGRVLRDSRVGDAVMVRDPDGQLIEVLPMAYALSVKSAP